MPRSESDPMPPTRELPQQPRHRAVPADLQARFPGHVPATYTHPDTLLVAFAFECNLACTFCMVEDALGTYPGTPLEVFEAFARHPDAMRGIKRVILSGGEVTLDENLHRYVAVARSVPGVQHVRVQTNATRLSHAPSVDRLLDAGVDEFFVSLHGHDAATCDAVTQRPGSFRHIVRGIETLAARGATWLSNTCIVQRNVDHLAAIVALAADHGAAAAELWNVWPRMDDDDLRREIVPMATLQPRLADALATCERRGLPATVKWVPRCLLGRFGEVHDDSQPTALIDRAYWQRLPRYACLYSGVCAFGQSCAGLSHAYIEQHGWEADRLEPERNLGHAPRPDRRGAMLDRADPVPFRGDEPTRAPSQHAGHDLAPVAVGEVLDGCVVTAVQPVRGGWRMTFRSGDETVTVRQVDDDGAPAFARSKGLAFSYEAGGDATLAQRVIESMIRSA